MTVCSVTAAKQHLYEIIFDDASSGMIDKTVWEHSGFTMGSVMSDEEWAALCDRSEAFRAREKALYYLSLRDYGKRELALKLSRAGIDKTLAEQTVTALCESGLINDTRYAAMLARDMSSRKLYPKQRIVMALKEKGFENAVIEEAILQIPAQDIQQALELLRKKRYNKLNMPSSRDKALAMLARYGFSYSTSRSALALLEEENEEDPEGA